MADRGRTRGALPVGRPRHARVRVRRAAGGQGRGGAGQLSRGIMDGIVFETPDRVRRFVDAPEVARTAELAVTLTIPAADAAELAPPQTRPQPGGGALRRLFGGRRSPAPPPGRGWGPQRGSLGGGNGQRDGQLPRSSRPRARRRSGAPGRASRTPAPPMMLSRALSEHLHDLAHQLLVGPGTECAQGDRPGSAPRVRPQ